MRCGRHRHRLCNAINVIHAIGAYERAGASAVVIEDKTFPKVTSLAAGRPDDDLWQFGIRASSTALKDSFRRTSLMAASRTSTSIL